MNCTSPGKQMRAGSSGGGQRQKAVVKSDSFPAAFRLYRKLQAHSHPFRRDFDSLKWVAVAQEVQ